MPKIIDLVEFHAGYGAQVRLLDYYYDRDLNSKHMAGYVPISSHRAAFLALARAQLPDPKNKEKVFMLTGSYGTGKSHLCLMLANYFSLKPTDYEMEQFFANWAKRDKNGAKNIQNWRGSGRYLVAPCDFGEARPFEDMLLSAIERALEEEGANDVMLDTHFKGALRRIEEWEKRKATGEPSGAFDDFVAYLGGDDPTEQLAILKAGLRQNKSASMDVFQQTFERATGQKLTLRSDSLLAILKDLLATPQFQKRYKGLVILADEFGYALSEGRVTMSVFQGFAEMSKDGVDGMQIIFVGTGHRRFEAYGANTALQIDFRVVQDRVTEVGLESEELEQIIAALVTPKTDEPVWQDTVQGTNKWLFTQMASGASKARIFDYLAEPELRQQIVQNIYPMHPMATYCLTRLSRELGSDARSVFSFFREHTDALPEGSYAWYAHTYDVTKPNNELNIYTPDLLTTYFKPEIRSDNFSVRPEIRDYLRNYIGAIDEAARFAYKNTLTKEIDPFTQRVLNLIFVYRVSNVNVTVDNLQYGLNLNTPQDKKLLASELKSLLNNKILFFAPSGEYEFRRTDMADLDALIAGYRQELISQPLDLVRQVTDLFSKRLEPWTEAKGHNQDYLGDKRLLRVFATPHELTATKKLPDGSEASFWDACDQQRRVQKNWNERYDGTMVYVICETESDIQQAQQAIKANNQASVIVGVPRVPLPIKESVIDLLAVQKFIEGPEYDKLEFQEKALVAEILGKDSDKTGRTGDFLRARERYLEAKGLYWYREDGKTLVAEPVNEYEPADTLMNRLFVSRNQVTHDYLSKVHPKSFSGSSDQALREAVAKLVDFDKPVSIDHSVKENRGEIRYLKLALVNQGILQQEGDYDGTTATYQLERSLEKVKDKYPAYVALLDHLKAIKRGETLPVWSTLTNLIEAPYGVGPYALAVFFASAIRYFGDELRIRTNPAGLGYTPTNDAEIIIDIATGRYPNAIVERRVLTPATAGLINDLFNVFSLTPARAGEQQTLSETWHALQSWWKQRTRLERTVGIYPENSSVQKFVDFLSKQSESSGASQTMLEEIKQIYSFHVNAELDDKDTSQILAGMKEDKLDVETRAKEIRSKLVKMLANLFSPEGDTYADYTSAMTRWYKELHSDQKLLTAEWQSPASRSLLEALLKLQDLEKTLLEVVPAAPGFNLGRVDDWSSDQSTSYTKTFRDAIRRIEDSLPKVPPPIYETSVASAPTYQGGSPTIQFSGQVKLAVNTPAPDVSVRITRNENPAVAKQYETVSAGEIWQETITESCTYYLVSQNSHGDFSKQIQIHFTNTDEGYKLIAESSAKLLPHEREYRFRNPVDKNGLVVLLTDIIDHLAQDHLLNGDDVLAAFEEARAAAAKLVEKEISR